jgi:hypothetical protein
MLVLDAEKHRYQRYVSDLAGQDIADHRSSPLTLIAQIRNWLRATSQANDTPGAHQIIERYTALRADLPAVCREMGLQHDDLSFHDFGWVITEWLRTRGA